MKATFDIPYGLMRAVKMRAVAEDRKLKDLVAELLEKGLSVPDPPVRDLSNRVALPIFWGGHRASPDEEMTPDRVAQILLQEEVDRALGR